MPLIMAVARERAEGEFRTALVPETAKKFAALGASLRMEQSAGVPSHFLDGDYAGVEAVTVWKPPMPARRSSCAWRRHRCPKSLSCLKAAS